MTASRKLAWDDNAQCWSCTECGWSFEPSDVFRDRSLNKYFDVVRRDEEFAIHLCADHNGNDVPR